MHAVSGNVLKLICSPAEGSVPHAIELCLLLKKKAAKSPSTLLNWRREADNQNLLHKHRPCLIIDRHNQANANRDSTAADSALALPTTRKCINGNRVGG